MGDGTQQQELRNMIGVVIPTAGRAELVAIALVNLSRQTRRPDWIVVSCAGPDDVPPECKTMAGCQTVVLFGDKGSTIQRNHGLRWLKRNTPLYEAESNMIVFLDDDFVMRNDWLAAAEQEFLGNPAVVGLTGILLADGAKNIGYSVADAVRIIETNQLLLPKRDWRLRQGLAAHSTLGCDMAFRATVISDIEFDENLPRYGWLEDFDFSSRVARVGEVRRIQTLVGVHLGSKHGRAPGREFGYSQMANPIYLYRKGTMGAGFAIKIMTRNIMANIGKSLWSEPFIDRRGRALGNVFALADMALGRLSPGRMTHPVASVRSQS
jgi:glycosyltransferase involved in cell wall biosynthesis